MPNGIFEKDSKEMDSSTVDYKTLQSQAEAKLRESGYCAFVLRNLVKRPFQRADDLENSYGIAYGAILAPLMLENYAKEAYANKSRKEFVRWLADHGGKITFSLVNTGEKSIERWAKEHQHYAEKPGILAPSEKGWLWFSIMVDQDVDLYMNEEAQPELYKLFRKNLAAYLADEIDIL